MHTHNIVSQLITAGYEERENRMHTCNMVSQLITAAYEERENNDAHT